MLVVLTPAPPPAAYYRAMPSQAVGGIGSLGAAMSADQIYQLARSVGFPPDMATKMTAVALRESTGDPTAYNGNRASGDDSYGLFQINLYSPSDPTYGARLMQQIGVTDPQQLFDPVTNAQAAYRMWNGSDANFNIAWGYKDYSQWMPEAVMAATGVDSGWQTGGPDPYPGVDAGFGGVSTTTLVFGGLVLAFLVLKG